MTFWKRWNYGDSKKITGCQGLEGREPWIRRAQRISRAVKLFCMMLHAIIHLSLCVGEGNGTPLQYSCLDNPMDRGAWWAVVHRVAKSRTQLSAFTFTFHFHVLEKETATHSSVLAWRIPGTGEPGGLSSMGLHRVRHDWSDLAAAAALCIMVDACH